jgi:O-antigen/teichoic acid export membrane protein
MLERMLPDGKEQTGIYAQAFRILDALSMFGFLFAGLLLPMFSRMLKKKEPLGSLLQLSYTLIIVPAITVAIIAFFYGSEIMKIMYKEHVAASTNLFGLLMIGFVGISTTYIFGTLLTANGNLRQLNLMALSGVIINILLNIFLIPRYYALGSAIASMITQICTGFAQVILSQRLLKLKINYNLIFRLALFIILLILTNLIIRQTHLTWYYGLGLVILMSMALASMLKLILPKNILIIMREKTN